MIYINKTMKSRVRITNLDADWIEWSLKNGLHKAEYIGKGKLATIRSYQRSALLYYKKSLTLTNSELEKEIASSKNKIVIMNESNSKVTWDNRQVTKWELLLVQVYSLQLPQQCLLTAQST